MSSAMSAEVLLCGAENESSCAIRSAVALSIAISCVWVGVSKITPQEV